MIKKNIQSVIKVLSARANNVKMSVYDEDSSDIQVSFNSTSVPLVGDIQGILGCFFNNPYEMIHIDHSWGFTEIYLSDGVFSKGKVDTKLLSLFVPFGAFDNLK